MKALLLLSLSLFAIAALAQDQPKSVGKATADSPARLQAKGNDLADLASPVRTCAYIHSFVFERQDGEAPKLVKETYCTPTGSFAVHRAFKPGLCPAVLTSERSDQRADSKAKPKTDSKAEGQPPLK